MSLPIAIQSVVFYVLACTPCGQVLHRHKAKNTAKSERKEKARVVAEQPHLYHHPDPFATNPFWDEEIRLGPSLRKGKNGKYIKEHGSKEMGSKELGSKELGSKELGSSVTAPESVLRPSTTHERPSTTRDVVPAKPTAHPHLDSSPTVVQEEDTASAVLSKTASVSTGGDWNLKRYQREDEELWGHELSRTGQKLMDAIKQAGTTAGRFMEAKLGIEKSVTEEDRHNFYFAPRNPPVNDYHPPVVRSKPAHRDDLRWMLQPPPSAKIMEGKVPVSRTASTMSVGSRRTAPGTADGRSMGRLVGERALEAKLRNGEFPHDEQNTIPTISPRKTRPRRGTTSSTQTRRRRTTSGSYMTSESDESEEEMYRRRSSRHQSRRAYVTHTMNSEESEDEYISMSIESLSTGMHTTTAHAKPRLPTIPSSDSNVKARASSEPALGRPLEDVVNMPSVSAGRDNVPGLEVLATSVDSGVGLHLR